MAIPDITFRMKSWNNWEVGVIDFLSSEIIQLKEEKARKRIIKKILFHQIKSDKLRNRNGEWKNKKKGRIKGNKRKIKSLPKKTKKNRRQK